MSQNRIVTNTGFGQEFFIQLALAWASGTPDAWTRLLEQWGEEQAKVLAKRAFFQRMVGDLPRIVKKMEKEGKNYSYSTPERPTPPAALIGDALYKMNKLWIPSGHFADMARDRQEPKITKLVAPLVGTSTPLSEILRLTAEEMTELIF